MTEEEAFKYCPKCGAKSLVGGKIDGLKCESCGFDFFLNPKPTSAAIIFDQQKRLLLTKRGINPHKGFWEFPGGFMKKHESAEQALKRELREELGITLTDLKYYRSQAETYAYKNMDLDILDMFFVCSYRGTPRPDDDVVDFDFFTVKNLPKIKPDHERIAKGIVLKDIIKN